MPLYEYKCLECGEHFEVLQKFSDEPLTVHKTCGGAVERLVSAPAFHFKGSGWYITDYAKKSNGNSSPARESKEPATEKKEAKTETATAAKTPEKTKTN